MAKIKPTCSVDGCEHVVQSKGLCRLHYQRVYRQRTPEKTRAYNTKRRMQNRPVCKHPGCDSELYTSNTVGYCVHHRHHAPRERACTECGTKFEGGKNRKVCNHCLACVDCGTIVKHACWGVERRCDACASARRARTQEERQREREAAEARERARQAQPAFRLGKALVDMRDRLAKAAPYFRRECGECGRVFYTNQPAQRFCCRTHGNRHNRRLMDSIRRMQMKKNGLPNVYRARIANRDGWRCGICGKRINPKLKHPHPLALSIDHIVPLAVGGTHEPANVQATHLRCNVRKAHRGESQLLMFG